MEHLTYSYTKNSVIDIPTRRFFVIGSSDPGFTVSGRKTITTETLILFSNGDEISKTEISSGSNKIDYVQWKYHGQYYFDLDDLLKNLPEYLAITIIFNLDEFRSIL